MNLCGIKINKFNIILFFFFSAFVYHVPQFLEMHGTLMQFNCQPVEKKSHWQSRAFHRGSQLAKHLTLSTCNKILGF